MSRKINVNPDQYKVAGRERQGENILHERGKAAVAKSRERERLSSRKRSIKKR
jgi:hypothetical protein